MNPLSVNCSNLPLSLLNSGNSTDEPSTSKGPFSCELCNKNFTRKDNLKQHILNIHSSEGMKPSRSKFPCELCNKTFFTKAYLKYHISAYHKDPLDNYEDPNRIPCPLCPKTFTRKRDMQRHVANLHSFQEDIGENEIIIENEEPIEYDISNVSHLLLNIYL